MRLFHGTNHDITDAVRPGVDVGHDNYGETGKEFGQESRKNSFATGSEESAWEYARNWSGRDQRSRVYEVHPSPGMRKGIFHEANEEYVAPTFAVKDRIDIMPGRQGTLPINWGQFARHLSGDDLNHPSNNAVAYGHDGAKRAHTPRLGDNTSTDSLN